MFYRVFSGARRREMIEFVCSCSSGRVGVQQCGKIESRLTHTFLSSSTSSGLRISLTLVIHHCHTGILIPAKQQSRIAQRREFWNTTRCRTRGCSHRRENEHFTADAHAVLESEQEQEHAALEEERKRTMGSKTVWRSLSWNSSCSPHAGVILP